MTEQETTIPPEQKLNDLIALVKKMRYYQKFWYVHGGFDNKNLKVMYEQEVDKFIKEKQ